MMNLFTESDHGTVPSKGDGMSGTRTMIPSVNSEYTPCRPFPQWMLNSSFFRSDIGGADDDGHDDSGSEAAEMDDVDYAEATYDVI